MLRKVVEKKAWRVPTEHLSRRTESWARKPQIRNVQIRNLAVLETKLGESNQKNATFSREISKLEPKNTIKLGQEHQKNKSHQLHGWPNFTHVLTLLPKSTHPPPTPSTSSKTNYHSWFLTLQSELQKKWFFPAEEAPSYKKSACLLQKNFVF